MTSIAHTHKDYSSDWWTPEPIWHWVHETLGRNVFDPCPAGYDEDEDEDGLECTWDPELPTYMNYPGGIKAARMWYRKALLEHGHAGRKALSRPLIICFFNSEHTRGLDPWIDHLPGWLIKTRDRTRFIWGGPDVYYSEDDPRAFDENGNHRIKRKRGEPAKSPTEWAWWWTSTAPAPFPGEHCVVGTGGFS